MMVIVAAVVGHRQRVAAIKHTLLMYCSGHANLMASSGGFKLRVAIPINSWVV